jgi:SNF2-related domain
MMQNSESGSKLDNSHSSLPEEIILLTKKYFPQGIIQNSLKFVRQSKVSISYKKGQVDQYYICSGIVKDDRSHECKINYKSRLEGTSEQALSSNCDCVLWKRESHCQHTLALFITFHLHEFLDRHAHNAEHLDLQGIQSEAPPLSFMSSLGVSPEEYGTLILSPNQLVQAPYGATYSQLQYILHSKKIIPFPLPSNFVGQLVIYFNDNQQMRFAYLEPEHNNLSEQDAAPKKLSKEVSLFENLYLFHWKTGQAFHLTQDIKQLIARLRSFQFHLSYNELLYSIFELNLTQHVQIFYENQNILSLPKVSPSTRVVINPGDKKTLLEFKLEFFDHAEKLLMPPLMLSQLTFGTGILTSFRKKNEAYDFLETIVRSIEDRSQNYKKHLHSTSKKNRIISLVEQVFKEEQSIVFDDINLCLIVYDNSFVLALLKNIYEKFSEQFFRFAYFQDVSKSLTYKIAPQQLFEGLQPFSKFAKNYAIQIFYDRQEISKWNSRIKFERRSSSTKWFDLELSMTNDDWKIIQEANIDNGIVITNSGLILLSDEEKDLIRMMQKYSKYEGKTVPLSELTEDELNKNVKKFILPFNKSRIFELFELKKLGIDGALDEAELALCRRLETLQEMPHYPLPENLEGVLRPYQVTGFNWLRFLHEANLGACLADDMGLGKTLQTIAFLQSIYHQIERVLIVCPVTILLNWEKEIQKFSNMEHHIYHGGSRHFPKDKKIILTSYGVMKKLISSFLMKSSI